MANTKENPSAENLPLPALFRKHGYPLQEHFEACMAALPDEAVERSDGSKTGRGYNTTGYGYQFITDRLNEVFGIGCWEISGDATNQDWGETAKGKRLYRSDFRGSISLGLWDAGEFTPCARKPMVGGHVSLDPIDAEKGALTNALKKAAAMLCGVGAEAYRGGIDDDNEPVGDRGRGSAAPPQRGPRSSETLAGNPNLLHCVRKMANGYETIMGEPDLLNDFEKDFLESYVKKFNEHGENAFCSLKQAEIIDEMWIRVRARFKAKAKAALAAALAAEEPQAPSTSADMSQEAPDDDLPF